MLYVTLPLFVATSALFCGFQMLSRDGRDQKGESLVVNVDMRSDLQPNPYVRKPMKDFENIQFHFHYNEPKSAVDGESKGMTDKYKTDDDVITKEAHKENSNGKTEAKAGTTKNPTSPKTEPKYNVNMAEDILKTEETYKRIKKVQLKSIQLVDDAILDQVKFKQRFNNLYQNMKEAESALKAAYDSNNDDFELIFHELMTEGFLASCKLYIDPAEDQADQTYNTKILEKQFIDITNKQMGEYKLLGKQHALLNDELSKVMPSNETLYRNYRDAKKFLGDLEVVKEYLGTWAIRKHEVEEGGGKLLRRIGKWRRNIKKNTDINEKIHEIEENIRHFITDIYPDEFKDATPNDIFQCFRMYNVLG